MFTKSTILLLFVIIFTILSGLWSIGNLDIQAKLTLNNGPASTSAKENVTPILPSGLDSSYENITISNGTGLFQGKTNIKSLHSVNYTQKNEQERSFFDFVPGDRNLFLKLKKEAPFNNNVTTNVIRIPPLTKNFNNITLSESSNYDINSSLQNSSANTKNITVQSLPSRSGFEPTGFIGLVSNQSCGSCTPPDVSITVGQHHIAEMINNYMSFWNKENHALEKLVNISEVYQLRKNDNTSDPSIVYDPSSAKWFSAVMLINKDVRETAVLSAVSNTDDPLGNWSVFRFNVTDNKKNLACPDRPIIGTSNDKVVISVNIVKPDRNGSCYNSSNSASGFQLIVINKSEMTTNVMNPLLNISVYHNMNWLTMIPTKTNEGNNLFLVSVGYKNADKVQIMLINGTNPNVQFLCSLRQLHSQTNVPPDAKQKDTDVVIDTADSRVLDASFQGGKIWLTFNDSCKPIDSDQPRSCFRLIQVDTTDANQFHDCKKEIRGGTVTMELDIGHKNTYYYRPALQTDREGNLFVIFGYSSDTVFPSLAALKLSKPDNSDINITAILIKEGIRNSTAEWQLLQPYEKCKDSGPMDKCSRYGDYFSASLDPADSSTVWLAGQYYENSTYSTYIAKVTSSGR